LNSILDADSNDEFFDYSSSPYDTVTLDCSYIDEYNYANIATSKNEISIMSLNIQSLPAKFNDFVSFISLLQISNKAPDVICLQELWQFPNDVNFNIQGYHPLIFKLRQNGVQGGGVGIYIKNVFKFTILQEISIFHDRLFESIFCEISCNSKKIIVGSIYRPNTPVYNLSPTEQFNQFCEILTNINFELQQFNSDLYLMGDFNIDVLKYQSCNLSKTYVDLLFSLGLLQVITKPTRCKPNSATLIDHVCTNSQSQSILSYIIISYISDHFPIIVKIRNVAAVPAPKFVEFRDFSHVNSINFTTALCALDWNDVLTTDDAQTAYNYFSDSFINLFNLFFPIKRLKFNRNVHSIEKWMTPGLLVSRKNKILLGKTFSKSQNLPS
jgi:hypothetical protein